jgi:hypothetical protein
MLDLLLRREGVSASRRQSLHEAAGLLQRIRNRAIAHVRHSFNYEKNLEAFGNLFLERIAARSESTHAHLVLQQI